MNVLIIKGLACYNKTEYFEQTCKILNAYRITLKFDSLTKIIQTDRNKGYSLYYNIVSCTLIIDMILV